MEAVYGILIPFLGTSLGAACVFFMKQSLSDRLQRSLTGFAAGVMVAASVWSLLIPSIEQSAALGAFAFVPQRSDSGPAFCSCWRLTISFHTCTRTAGRPKAPKAACSARP